MNHLIVVDMQNDFIDGALGTPEAQAIVPRAVDKIKTWDGDVWFTMDTHGRDYWDTLEGKNLPVPHCKVLTHGWILHEKIHEAAAERTTPVPRDHIIEKPTFGSVELANQLANLFNACTDSVTSITLIGLCTDICVISNAMFLKAALPNVPIIVDASCCAGVTPETHQNALKAMQQCQIIIENNSDHAVRDVN